MPALLTWLKINFAIIQQKIHRKITERLQFGNVAMRDLPVERMSKGGKVLWQGHLDEEDFLSSQGKQ